MARLLKPETLFFVVALAAMLFVFRDRALNDPGTLWHTRVGQMILADGFMTTDPFTFPFEGKTWIPQQWGGEVLMAWLHALGGWDAMLVAYAALFSFALALIFKRLLTGGMGWPLAAIVAGLAAIAMGFHFYLRPHVVTIVFMVLETLILCDVDAKRRTYYYLLWLIPLHLIWTNIHGGMLGGLATFGLAACAWTIRLSGDSTVKERMKKFLFLTVIGVSCALTMFINPIGLELQRTWFRLIGSKTLAEYVPEHSPLDLERGGDQAVLGFAILFLVILFAAGKPRVFWLMPLAWLILSIQSIRNGPLFVATASVMIAEIWPHTYWHRLFLARGDTLAKPPYAPVFEWRAWILPALFVFVPLLTLRDWARFGSNAKPPATIDIALKLIPEGERIYNDPLFGGYLIWTFPKHPIFMDDRFELCGDAWLEHYVQVTQIQPNLFDDWQRRYGFGWALIETNLTPVLDLYLQKHPEWKLNCHAGGVALYKRTP